MAEENEKSAGSGGGGGDSKNPLLVITLILNTVLMGAVAFLLWQNHKTASQITTVQDVVNSSIAEDAARAAVASEQEKDKAKGKDNKKPADFGGKLFPLQSFSANLAQGDGPRRFIRLEPVLKFSADAKDEELEARKPQIRDKIISILNSKRPEDLLKPEGKVYLKEEIKSAINSFLINGRAVDVYYVGFQIN